jgi:hypothetical protein
MVGKTGIDSPKHQFRQFTGTNRHISIRGSAVLIKIGFEAMNSLMINKTKVNNAMYSYILKKESEVKHKKIAKVARLNKFLRIYYVRVMEVYK